MIEAAEEERGGGLAPDDWLRWALEHPRPGDFLLEMKAAGLIGLYPELAAMVDVPQEPQWHPEGPVDVHVAHVVNAAAEIAVREALDAGNRAVLLFSALTHDLGKPRTTVRRKKADGRMHWTSYGHDRAGVPIAQSFLQRIGMDAGLTDRVGPLVESHMQYHAFKDPNADAHTVRRLAYRLAPATMRQLGYLIEADHSGRPPLPKQIPAAARRMLDLAERAGVMDGFRRR